jgi:Secretion system C-terminal sorting domain
MAGNTYAYKILQGVRPDSSKIKAKVSIKITDTRLNKPAYLKNGVKVNFIPFKPAKDNFFGNTKIMSASKSGDNDKVLNNVKVYPNPISDQLNLSFSMSKDANVIVKIMDVLGNEITTLLSERVAAGDQTKPFIIASRITSGFYFIRVSVGSEIITKRISVL